MSTTPYRYLKRQGIQLANPFEESRLKKWNYLYILSQPKLDGDRCLVKWIDGRPKLFTSEGNVFETVPHINEQLEELGELPFSLDGELYLHGLEHSELHGIVSASRTSLHKDFSKIELHLFDLVSEANQWDRLCQLGCLRRDLPNIDFVETTRINATSEAVFNQLRRYQSEGYEGIILRHPFGFYRETNGNTRSPHLMKFKPMKQDQYLICGYSIELDKNGVPKPNSLGRLLCCGSENLTPEWIGQYPATRKPPAGYFCIGSGFTDKEREELWLQREELKNREVLINYQHLTSANRVPRHGVYQSLVSRRQRDES